MSEIGNQKSCTAPDRQPQVTEQLEGRSALGQYRDNLLDELHGALVDHGQRIYAIVSQEDPEPPCGVSPTADLPVMVDLADHLRTGNQVDDAHNDRIQSLIHIVRSLTNRVEL